MRALGKASLFLAALAWAPLASADPILPAPATSATDGALASLALGFQRQQDVFATAENGLSLDVVINPGDVATVRTFFGQTAQSDFQTATGKHPFSVMSSFGEWGDEGNFAGISSVGVAARLMVLEKTGAPAAEIASARSAAVAAARAWHVYGSIGGPGIVARGIRRTTPLDPTAPALPGTLPATVPLRDAQGNALPAQKTDTWRQPVATSDAGWIWIDDTSKDQVSGYALAVAWLWDALKGDPGVPADVTANLAADLLAFARELQKVAPEFGIDLCIRDADGRLTAFHDLNPRQVVPDGAPLPETSTLRNGFNAALALGILRAAYHVTGDPDLGRYYYEDLVGARDLPGEMASNSGVIFLGPTTNFSNVNMLAIGLLTIARFETDPYVRSRLEETLAHQFWSTGDPDDVSHSGQPFFDVIYGAYAAGVTADIRGRMQADLAGFQPAPAFERDIVNCSPAAISAGVCTAVDGKTVIHIASQPGHGGELVAADVVPMSVRPDSDFEWRSSPFRVNGTASTLMDPRGDWLTAYWLGRLLDTDPARNVSPYARGPLAYTMPDAGASVADAGGDVLPAAASGCGCGTVPADGLAWGGAGLVAVAAAALARRRRRT